MDADRFDALSRNLTRFGSRRGALKTLASGALGGLLSLGGLREAAAACRLIAQRCNADNPCCKGSRCAQGRCQCKTAAGYQPCNGPKTRCVNTNTSTAHCGTCDIPCPSGATCIEGQCVCPNSAPTICNDTCVDTLSDANHCKGCNQACPTGATCVVGRCQCPSDAPTLCNDTCVDLTTNDDHCSKCNNACPATHSCRPGVTSGACCSISETGANCMCQPSGALCDFDFCCNGPCSQSGICP